MYAPWFRSSRRLGPDGNRWKSSVRPRRTIAVVTAEEFIPRVTGQSDGDMPAGLTSDVPGR